jgi:hypothetical protein
VRFRAPLYGWSLAENTPENIMSINDYLVSNAKLEILERSTRLLRKKKMT